MRLLLDTHALVWWMRGDGRLSTAASDAIAERTNEVFVSAATAWELSTKYRLGRRKEVESLAQSFLSEIRAEGFIPLDITVEHGHAAGSLRDNHGDPFDRMLVAQALDEKLAVVSNDELFDRFDIVRIW